MSVKIVRRVADPVLKVEAVTLEDEHGARLVVQQPVAMINPKQHNYQSERGTGNLLKDWHDAHIEEGIRLLEANQQGFADFIKMLGHDPKKVTTTAATSIDLDDPMAGTGYAGCC